MAPLTLEWTGDLTFESTPDSPAIRLASSTPGVPSPVDALAYAVMGCMGMDVAFVLRKGRHRIDSLRVRFTGVREPDPPRRFTAMSLTFDVVSSAEARVVERAIVLSREKYCSVWHTIRPDVELTTSFALSPVPASGQPDAR